MREDIREPSIFSTEVSMEDAPAVLNALLEDAVLGAGGTHQFGEDFDEEEFYEEIHEGIDALLVDVDLASMEESIDRELEHREVAAQKVVESRTRRSEAFNVIWMGTTLMLIIALIQVLAEVAVHVLVIWGAVVALPFLSYKMHQAVERNRLQAVRQEVLNEAEGLKRDSERHAVEARVLELEGDGSSVESRRLKRAAARCEAEADVLGHAAWLIKSQAGLR